nr:STAS domain-containing protein [Desulfobacterales bacterium]
MAERLVADGVKSMEEERLLSKVSMNIVRGCLVVPVHIELYDEAVVQIQKEVLEMVNRRGVKGVIIDLSGVEVLDSFLANAIFDTARMASLLGAVVVFTGFKAEVVASIVDLDIEFNDINSTLTLEEAFQRLEPVVKPKQKT